MLLTRNVLASNPPPSPSHDPTSTKTASPLIIPPCPSPTPSSLLSLLSSGASPTPPLLASSSPSTSSAAASTTAATYPPSSRLLQLQTQLQQINLQWTQIQNQIQAHSLQSTHLQIQIQKVVRSTVEMLVLVVNALVITRDADRIRGVQIWVASWGGGMRGGGGEGVAGVKTGGTADKDSSASSTSKASPPAPSLSTTPSLALLAAEELKWMEAAALQAEGRFEGAIRIYETYLWGPSGSSGSPSGSSSKSSSKSSSNESTDHPPNIIRAFVMSQRRRCLGMIASSNPSTPQSLIRITNLFKMASLEASIQLPLFSSLAARRTNWLIEVEDGRDGAYETALSKGKMDIKTIKKDTTTSKQIDTATHSHAPLSMAKNSPSVVSSSVVSSSVVSSSVVSSAVSSSSTSISVSSSSSPSSSRKVRLIPVNVVRRPSRRDGVVLDPETGRRPHPSSSTSSSTSSFTPSTSTSTSTSTSAARSLQTSALPPSSLPPSPPPLPNVPQMMPTSRRFLSPSFEAVGMTTTVEIPAVAEASRRGSGSGKTEWALRERDEKALVIA
eukprot:CAMPEP_0175069440 /NCGR_PEP_ID=MMETSP0052_2-20121109/18195_1 /TAXON_ID=51329 ORGANISM="Polytomella parva, Strain SAG 63-3" /NCGR_SAMPLE_ID=MMETSP0052_2 /ASSEMBLY_ACC=CAM_ASM_000194 /LENGTH=555 /DNA_ID=CAMNT_0016336513 /DNA_START=94 /DNA_END=1758 /DNA_ORIENTATION=+